MPQATERRVVPLGHIAGVHGVQGWVKVFSLTEPRETIFEYQPWLLGDDREEVSVSQGKQHGNRLIALLENVTGREQAEQLVGRQIAVYRDQFPALPEDEYYWTDLVGLSVNLADGTELGTIDRMLATGAHDVMVVRGERERLIPFVMGRYVKQVSLEEATVVVDWDPEF